MLKIERQNIIARELSKQGFVLVPALSELFRCSEETVRRDLKEMEREGKLVRTHGGAYQLERFDKSYPTNLRKTYLRQTKSRLAAQAIGHVQENDVIMLDSSTTCLAVAEAIAQTQIPLTVITNSLLICTLCSERDTNIDLICVGGALRRRTSSFTNQHTIEQLRCYHADIAFISCPKITIEFGLSDNHLSEAKVRETMLRQSKRRYLIMDHTKFDESANVIIDALESVDHIITDQTLGSDWEAFAKRHHIEIEYCIKP